LQVFMNDPGHRKRTREAGRGAESGIFSRWRGHGKAPPDELWFMANKNVAGDRMETIGLWSNRSKITLASGASCQRRRQLPSSPVREICSSPVMDRFLIYERAGALLNSYIEISLAVAVQARIIALSDRQVSCACAPGARG